MIINGFPLTKMIRPPIVDMVDYKVQGYQASWGLTEVGYDIRLKQTVTLSPWNWTVDDPDHGYTSGSGRFCLASTLEEFDMPHNLCGIVHDKSTWARKGLSVFNTVIEPGWRGFLTLELVYHGEQPLRLEAGTGIAQVIFHEIQTPARYEGKYQDQADMPVPSI